MTWVLTRRGKLDTETDMQRVHNVKIHREKMAM